MPKPDNGNYLWIQVFYSALNENGRSGFVMANSASDARGSEQDIRKSLIEDGAVDVMVAVGSNFFYTVTLPLWFLANIVRLYRGEEIETTNSSASMLKEKFPDGKYVDVAGLCRVAALSEIEAQGWSLNPGRYVGVAEREADDFDFKERLEELNEGLETLNVEARELEGRIAENVDTLLEAG